MTFFYLTSPPLPSRRGQKASGEGVGSSHPGIHVAEDRRYIDSARIALVGADLTLYPLCLRPRNVLPGVSYPNPDIRPDKQPSPPFRPRRHAGIVLPGPLSPISHPPSPPFSPFGERSESPFAGTAREPLSGAASYRGQPRKKWSGADMSSSLPSSAPSLPPSPVLKFRDVAEDQVKTT